MEVVDNGVFIKCSFCVKTWLGLTLQYGLLLEQELTNEPADHIWPTAFFCKEGLIGTQPSHSFLFCVGLLSLYNSRVE